MSRGALTPWHTALMKMELIAKACQSIINIEGIYGTIHSEGSSEEGMLSITYLWAGKMLIFKSMIYKYHCGRRHGYFDGMLIQGRWNLRKLYTLYKMIWSIVFENIKSARKC